MSCTLSTEPKKPSVRPPVLLSRLADYWSLTKPEVNFLILITTFAGFYLGGADQGHQFSFLGLCNTLFGTLLVASGTATLNQYIEREFDARMRRTSRRPAASGRLGAAKAWCLGSRSQLQAAFILQRLST
jgi:heme o synthase